MSSAVSNFGATGTPSHKDLKLSNLVVDNHLVVHRFFSERLRTNHVKSQVVESDVVAASIVNVSQPYQMDGIDILHAGPGGYVAVGTGALQAIGPNPDPTLSSRLNSVAVGSEALQSLVLPTADPIDYSSTGNTAIGEAALTSSVSDAFNTAVGDHALNQLQGTSGSPASFNTAVGQSTLYSNLTGSNNTALGAQALGADQSGSNNTAVGSFVMSNPVQGSLNTAVGFAAGGGIQGGTNNVIIGANAVPDNSPSEYANGSGNTIVGARTLMPAGSTFNNIILLGNGAQPETVNGDGQIGFGSLVLAVTATNGGGFAMTAPANWLKVNVTPEGGGTAVAYRIPLFNP